MAIYLRLTLIVLVLAPMLVDAAGLAKPPNNLGLVTYWRFNEGSGTRVIDYSGNANTGTIVNGSVFEASGKPGHGTNLDFSGWSGSNDYVVGGKIVNVANVTHSAWIRLSEVSIFNGHIVGFMDGIGSGSTAKNLFIGTDGKIYFYIFDGSAHTTSAPTDTIPLNQWVHVAATADGTTARVYMNGVEVGSVSSGAPLDSYTVPNLFVNGATGVPATNGFYVDVDIDEVRTYNRALTAAQIQALYQQGYAQLNASSVTLTSGSSLGSGLVGHWTFDGSKLVSNVSDSSGSGNTGYLRSFAATTTLPGKLGQALSFDGTDDVVTASSTSFAVAGDLTYAVWVKPDSLNSVFGNCVICQSYPSYGTPDPTMFGAHLSLFDIVAGGAGQAQAKVYGSGVSTFVSSTEGDVPVGVWSHLALTIQGTTLTLYLNGQFVDSDTISSRTVTGALWIGGEEYFNLAWLDGGIDDARVYNRALGAHEVKQLYTLGAAKAHASSVTLQQGSSLTSGLVGHWTFDGLDTLSSITDKSGNGYHGYFYGGATSTAKIPGKLGQALRFNGSTRYVSVPTISIPSDISASAWVHSTDFDHNGMVILKGAVNEQWSFFFAADTNDLKWRGSTTASVDCTPLPANNAWHHIVATQTGTTAIVYVDGVVCNSGTVAAIANAANPIAIGRFDDFGGSYYFNGSIDDVRLYNRVLSADEVKQLYRMGK